MDDLIKALVREVRTREGHNPCDPISEALMANMELRIKGFIADKLGICTPQALFESNEYTAMMSRGELEDRQVDACS